MNGVNNDNDISITSIKNLEETLMKIEKIKKNEILKKEIEDLH